jgi:hypothetical protein
MRHLKQIIALIGEFAPDFSEARERRRELRRKLRTTIESIQKDGKVATLSTDPFEMEYLNGGLEKIPFELNKQIREQGTELQTEFAIEMYQINSQYEKVLVSSFQDRIDTINRRIWMLWLGQIVYWMIITGSLIVLAAVGGYSAVCLIF